VDCAAYELCRNDNCVQDPPLTGQDWVDCEQGCASASTVEAVALYGIFEDCINCDACAISCGSQEGIYCEDVPCDGDTVDCYDQADGCWGCAMNTTCEDEVAACTASTECSALDACRNSDCSETTGDAWTACVTACETANPGGVALLNAYHTCIYCEGCPISCAADAGNRCN
jgi:hypothetical protein